MESLKAAWFKLASSYLDDSSLLDNYWKEIQSNYSGAKRHYHNLFHIGHLLKQAHTYKEHIEDFDILCFSIWYHDIIYKVSRKDNELKSADLALDRLKVFGLTTERLDRCHYQIVSTKLHQKDNDQDVNFLLDFDLSILAASKEEYLEYTRQIRKEYSIYPDLLYKPGRRKVLKHFLALDNIFKTPIYNKLHEERARENLKEELKLLK